MHQIALIYTLTVGFSFALLFGLVTHRLKLSPIVGYLLAGLVVRPSTPGFIADAALAPQLAEVGVILLMFGVGLHFKIQDLLNVKSVAIPGAIVQSILATALGALVAILFGWDVHAAVVLGLALSVASTVVLVHVLADNDLITTHGGRIAVGWLVVEDLLTVLALVLLPAVGKSADSSDPHVITTIAIAVLKLALMIPLILIGGAKLIPWILSQAARTRSRELFTLTVLTVALGIAMGAASIFGASLALGAFLSGIVVGQSDVHHQAAADALPMRDAFAVLFFVSIGMLLDPRFLIQYPGLILATMAVILLGKSLAAFVITLVLRESVKTALVVAIGLAQIGEFSFILAEVARLSGLLPVHGTDVLVAGALLSIAVNPLLFRNREHIERLLRRNAFIWRVLNFRSRSEQDHVGTLHVEDEEHERRAIIVGYGPVGQTFANMLKEFEICFTVIDLNLETVRKLRAQGRSAIYGDAGTRAILEAARIHSARYLLVTLPDLAGRVAVIATARILNPELTIISRARYLAERAMLEDAGVNDVVYEEAEVARALSEHLSRQLRHDEPDVLQPE
jgi:CPA2 family monovalent cation:H+ antiporter-2